MLAHKGVLVSDPSLDDMTPTRWVFEYAGIAKKKETEWKAMANAAKNMMVHFLGLDAVPPMEDQTTGGLSAPIAEYMPLVAFLNPELYANTMKKRFDYENQKKMERGEDPVSGSKEYDEMVANFDDLIPIFEENFESADEKVYDERLEVAKKAGIIQVVEGELPPAKPVQQQNPMKSRRVKLDLEDGQ